MEHYQEHLVSKVVLMQRIFRCSLLAGALLLITICTGALVYHLTEGLAWVDAFLNAVMMMTGLGLTITLTTASAKIFTSFYAVISTIVFFGVLGILFAPLIHRFLHRFHLDLDKDK